MTLADSQSPFGPGWERLPKFAEARGQSPDRMRQQARNRLSRLGLAQRDSDGWWWLKTVEVENLLGLMLEEADHQAAAGKGDDWRRHAIQLTEALAGAIKVADRALDLLSR